MTKNNLVEKILKSTKSDNMDILETFYIVNGL